MGPERQLNLSLVPGSLLIAAVFAEMFLMAALFLGGAVGFGDDFAALVVLRRAALFYPFVFPPCRLPAPTRRGIADAPRPAPKAKKCRRGKIGTRNKQ